MYTFVIGPGFSPGSLIALDQLATVQLLMPY